MEQAFIHLILILMGKKNRISFLMFEQLNQ